MAFSMLDYLKDPPYGFEDVVRTHFWIKKHEILAQISTWKELHSKAQESAAKQNVEQHESVYGRETEISVPFDTIHDQLRQKLSDLQRPSLL